MILFVSFQERNKQHQGDELSGSKAEETRVEGRGSSKVRGEITPSDPDKLDKRKINTQGSLTDTNISPYLHQQLEDRI